MRILLTGGSGRFGWAFRREATGHQLAAPPHTGPDALDLDNPATATAWMERVQPDWLVHAAAMTDVDACERDPETAQRRNGDATGALAQAAKAAGCRIAYLSTDYVFDGRKGNYRETDAPHPLSAYGKSKLDGERQAAAADPRALIVRTSMLFGAPERSDFIRHVRTAARQGQTVRVVDQRGSPTHCSDLARQVMALVEDGAHGIHHAAGATAATRLEVARAVLGANARIEVVKPEDVGWLAVRPHDSSLDTRKVRTHAQPWTLAEALRRTEAA